MFEDNYTAQSVSFPEFCSIAQSAGYNGVELRRTQVNLETSKSKRKELLSAAKDFGLLITCLTLRGIPESGKQRDVFLNKYLDLCAELECSLLKVSGTPEWLNHTSEKAKSRGIVLAQNNHKDGPLETVEGTKRFFKSVKHPNFTLLYDSLHLYAAREDYIGCIPDFINITSNILVHSVHTETSKEEEKSVVQFGAGKFVSCLPDDDGSQNWSAIFRAFKKENYNGLITVIENDWPQDMRIKIAKYNINYIKSLI